MALAYLIDPDTPKNDGTFRPLTVIAREGTVVWANPPAPVTLCTNHCAQEIAEAVIKALAAGVPGPRRSAGWGRRFRIAIQGTRPAQRPPLHLAHVPRAAGRRRLVGRRRLADGRRGAGGRRHQVRQRRGHRGALPALLRAPRVPAGLGGATGATGAASGRRARARTPRSTSRPARTPPGTAMRHAPYGILGGQGRPARTAIASAPAAGPIRVLQTKEVGVVVRARRRLPGGVGRRRGLRRPAAAHARGARVRPGERLRDAGPGPGDRARAARRRRGGRRPARPAPRKGR